MSLIKKRNNLTFPSIMEDFLRPNWWGEFESINANMPAVNIKETDSDFTVEMAVPGMKKEDFNVELDDNILSVSSEAKTEQEEKDEEGRYTRREFSYSSFKRSFTLPENVKEDEVNATYDNGVLHITLPKRDEKPMSMKRSINIR